MSERMGAGADTQSQPARSIEETGGGPKGQECSVTEMESEERQEG